jgi:glycosyltransferase involved in cell wall biosynthesis
MRIAIVNCYYDIGLAEPEALLARYPTLVDWAEAVASAGAQVDVVQLFAYDAEVTRAGVAYRFVRSEPGLLACELRVLQSICPDVVHVHGLAYAPAAERIAGLLPRTPILIQDHADSPPRSPLRRLALRRALRHVAAVSFTATELARPWIDAGVFARQLRVIPLIESTSRFRLQDRLSARAKTGLSGDPLCLWVGRLDGNKDPLTVLRGFARALPRLPDARLAMAYGEDDLLPAVRAWLRENPEAAARVSLLGRVPHADLEAVYNSADIFVLGSHHESCGFALLEALACGVMPVVTDIPSFRRLLDGLDGIGGSLRPPDDPAATAEALVQTWQHRIPDVRQRIRRHFDSRCSLEALGRDALAAYSSLTVRSPASGVLVRGMS